MSQRIFVDENFRLFAGFVTKPQSSMGASNWKYRRKQLGIVIVINEDKR
jgi:hypothetical protein